MLRKRKTVSRKTALELLERMSVVYDILSVSLETETKEVKDHFGQTLTRKVVEKTLSFVLRPK